MSLELSTSRTAYVANGVQTVFPTGFSFGDKDDLTVEVSAGGVGTPVTQVRGVDYHVSGDGDPEPGGNVTFLVAPTSLDGVIITRNTPLTQPIDFESQGDFLPETHEAVFDHQERQIQELRRDIDDAIAGVVIPEADAGIATDGPYTCPDPQTERVISTASVLPGQVPAAVLIGRVVDNTDGVTVQTGLGTPDWSDVALEEFTVRYVPGLIPGHSYTITYVVFAV